MIDRLSMSNGIKPFQKAELPDKKDAAAPKADIKPLFSKDDAQKNIAGLQHRVEGKAAQKIDLQGKIAAKGDVLSGLLAKANSVPSEPLKTPKGGINITA